MEEKRRFVFFWSSIIIPILLLVGGYFVIVYLIDIWENEGTHKFLTSFILSFSLVLVIIYVVLFFFRRLIEKDITRRGKLIKRRLSRYRKIVDYITSFVLLAMLYYFWLSESWIIVLIVIVLLSDRIYVLLRGD